MAGVAVSILNYHSAHSTVDCVQSLLVANQDGSWPYSLEIYIVDNASGESDRRHLQQSLAELPNVHVYMNAENLGFAAGHNLNLNAMFQQSSPDYVWLLNNDCLVHGGAISSLIKSAMQQPEVGLWGATILESDGETIQCAGGCFYNSWVSSYRQYGKGKSLEQVDQLELVGFDYISGASLFFPVASLQKGLGSLPLKSDKTGADAQQWLNESFFLYFEELDLAQRLKPGFGMAWCKGALIKHAGGASTGTIENQRTELAEYHSTLSALKFTRLYYTNRLWFMAPGRYFSKCLLLMIRGEFKLIGAMTRAYLDFWFDRLD